MARRGLERLRYAAVYWCPACNIKTAYSRPWTFHLPFHRCCPRCGNTRIEHMKRRDRIDPMYKNPLSLIQVLFGARLWWCPLCRIQFYDMRPAQPPPMKEQS